MRLSSAGLAVLLLATLVATSSAAPKAAAPTSCNCPAPKKANLRALSAAGEEEVVEDIEIGDDAGRELKTDGKPCPVKVNCKKNFKQGAPECGKPCLAQCNRECAPPKAPAATAHPTTPPAKAHPANNAANKPGQNKPGDKPATKPAQIQKVDCASKPGGKCWSSCPGESYDHGSCSNSSHKCCKVLCEHNGGVCKKDCGKKCDKLVKKLGKGTYWSPKQCTAEPDRGLCNTQGEVCCTARKFNSDDIDYWNKKNEPNDPPTDAQRPGACVKCPDNDKDDKPSKNVKTCREQYGVCGPNVSDVCRRAAKLVNVKYLGDYQCGTIRASDCDPDESCIQHFFVPKDLEKGSSSSSDDWYHPHPHPAHRATLDDSLKPEWDFEDVPKH